MSNLASQLRLRNALPRLDEIVDEIPRVRGGSGIYSTCNANISDSSVAGDFQCASWSIQDK